MAHPEQQYLQLIRRIMEEGSVEQTRNGPVQCVFGHMMRFSLRHGEIPLLTTKKVAWRTCFHELMWFLKGDTSNYSLTRKNVHIWDANASRSFLDSRGLTHLQEGDLGPIYGHQWRHFNAPYTTSGDNYTGKGVDQIARAIHEIKTNPTSRRILVCAWNPSQLDEMALPPCHVLFQFHVKDGKYLSCALTQRSGDVGLGVPFNIASYSLLTHLVAHQCGLEADEFVYTLNNAHIYMDHIPALVEQMNRIPTDFPRVSIEPQEARNMDEYEIQDIIWTRPYVHLPAIHMDMIA